jgi:hypothetical protein
MRTMRNRGLKRYLAAGIIVSALMIMPGRVAEAGLRFNGKDDCLVTEKSLTEGRNAITLMMWVKGEYKPGNLVNGAVELQFWPTLGFALTCSDVSSSLYGSGSRYLNWDKDVTASKNWRHLTAVWSSPAAGDGKMKLYIDGIRQDHDLAYSGGTNGVLRGDKRIMFFAVFNMCIGAFKGEAEDLRIYNRALTENEVLAVYTAEGADNVKQGLVLWYPMKNKESELMEEEKNRFVIQDQSGCNNHGQVRGAPVWQTNDNSRAELQRREQINTTREWLKRKKSECNDQRLLLEKWFGAHPEAPEKWRGSFADLNRRFDMIKTDEICWARDILYGYYDLQVEVIMAELFPAPVSGKMQKGGN